MQTFHSLDSRLLYSLIVAVGVWLQTGHPARFQADIQVVARGYILAMTLSSHVLCAQRKSAVDPIPFR